MMTNKDIEKVEKEHDEYLKQKNIRNEKDAKEYYENKQKEYYENKSY